MREFFFSFHQTISFAIIYAIMIILILIAIAFFTVLERKVLAAVQRRRGPNMVGFWGLLQAFADGIKLLTKEPVFVSGANYYIFLSAPIILLASSLTMWIFFPFPGFRYGVITNYSFIVVFLFSALNSFSIILAGIVSNSRYSLIGGVRAIAQLISYEIPLSVTLLTLFCIQGSYSLHDFAAAKIAYAAVAFPSLLIFFISLLAETNRTPFDLPEAEAELVAGYNLEYSSILFALFFLAEYSNILFAASLMSLLFFPQNWFYFGIIVFCLLVILIRAVLPRYTFPQLINLCWVSLFPMSVLLLALTTLMMYIFNLYTGDFIRQDISCLADRLIDEAREIKNVLPSPSNGGLMAALPGLVLLSSAWFMSGSRNEEFNAFAELHREPISANNVLIFFCTALVIVIGIVSVNWLFINFKTNNVKNSPFECGFEPLGSPVSGFIPNFTTVAIIFLIYDVEVILTYPWAYSMVGKTAGAVSVFIVYLFIMLISLVYEVIDESFNIV